LAAWALSACIALSCSTLFVYLDIRSRRVSEGGYRANAHVFQVFSTNGTIVIEWGPWNFPGAWQTSWRAHAPGSKPRPLSDFKQRWSAFGFGLGIAGSTNKRLVQVEFPHLACTLLFLSAGAWFTRRFWCLRQLMRRAVRGLCPSCGYDLRATPDQCPECGWCARRTSVFMPSDDALARLGGGTSRRVGDDAVSNPGATD
jgi:hypothetical protein